MVVIVGAAGDLSFAGSEYLEVVHGGIAGRPQKPGLSDERMYSDLIRSMVERGLVDTAHDISGGGEVFVLAEMAISGGIGFEYDEDELERFLEYTRRADLSFFGEFGASFLIAFPDERWEAVQDTLGATDSSGVAWVAYDEVGRTGGDRFRIGDYIDLGLDELREAYERDLFG